jgi:hypothetical protein
MPIDKLMATQATLATVYGMQIGAQPEKAGEIFYNQSAPTKSELGVAKWLGYSNVILGATYGVLSTCDLKPADKKKLYSVGVASCGAGMAIAQHQKGANNFDKTQATVATAMNLTMGALYLKKVLEK